MTSPTCPLHAFLLGRFALQQDERALALPDDQAARRLLAYLLLHRDQRLTYSQLTTCLWPERPPAQAEGQLVQALADLQATLPLTGLLQTTDQFIVLPAAVFWTDAAAFEALVLLHTAIDPADAESAPDLWEAMTLYRGDLLPGWDEAWLQAERWRLRQLYHNALKWLITRARHGGGFERGLAYAQAYAANEPLFEVAHRETIRFHLHLGQFQEALAQYETCCQLLHEQGGLEPEAETTALVRPLLVAVAGEPQPPALAPTVGQLEAHLLGPFTLCREGEGLDLPSLSVVQELLAYLLLHPGRRHARSWLLGLFWPDLDEGQARRALSQALWHAHQTLPPLPGGEPIVTDEMRVTFAASAPIWIDAAVFRGLVEPLLGARDLDEDADIVMEAPPGRTAVSDLRQALGLYHDELLTGWHANWVCEARRDLRRLYRRGVRRMIAWQKYERRYEAALADAQRLLGRDPLQEAIIREVIQLEWAAGRPMQALRQYQESRALLRAELGVEPQAATIVLAARIRRARRGHKPTLPERLSGAQVPLFGRAREQGRLVNYIVGILVPKEPPGGGLVMIEGEAGVGKTHLIEAAIEETRWQGFKVLWGAGREREAQPPFGSLVEALRGGLSKTLAQRLAGHVERIWWQALAPLIPGLAEWLELAPASRLEPEQERERLVEAFVQVLAGWGAVSRLVVVLEDAQWLGADLLDVLPTLARRLKDERALIVLSYRGEEVRQDAESWRALQEIGHHIRGRIALGRLEAEASGALMRHVLQCEEAAPLFEARLYRETEGNPLFLLETLRALYEEELLYREEDGAWATPFDEMTVDYGELPRARRVEAVIARRLEMLDEVQRHVLGVAAVLGRESRYDLLRAVVDVDEDTLLKALEALEHWHYLVETREGGRFCHDKLRQVAYERLPEGERRRLHGRAAEALEAEQGGQVAVLAEHYLQAQVWDKAVTYLVQAAEEAQARYAYGVALERYTQALTLLKQHAPFTGSRNVELRFDVLCKQYYLLWDRGECQQAEASLRSLQQTVQGLDDPQRQAEALNQHLDFLYRASRFDEVVAVADEALALAQAHGLTRQMARTLKTKGEACSKCDREEGEQVLHHALDLWRKVGSVNSGEAVRMRAEILMSLVFYYVQRGLHTPAERAGQRLAALAQESESPMVAVSAFYSQAQLAEARGDYEAGLHYKQDCLELIRRVGLRRWEQAILTSLGNALAVRRAYGPAFAHYRRALELARQSADDYGIVTTRYNLGFLLSITGRHADAEAHLSASLELAGERELSSWKALALSGLGILYLQESQPGRRERARAEHYLQEALEILSAQQLEYGAPGVHYGLGLLSLSRQSVERAATHFEKGLEIAERSGDPVAAICCSYLALCHHLQNRREEALQLSARAVKLVESAASASYPQVVYRHRGRILDAQGQKVAARELLEKAYASIQAQKETLPDPDWQRAFLENVPANREIVAIYEVIQAQVQAGRI